METPIVTTPHPQSHENREYWNNVLTDIIKDPSIVDKIADLFAQQIMFDALHKFPSVAATCAPLIDSSIDKKYKIARKIAFIILPPKDINNPADRVRSYINYTKVRNPIKHKYQLMEEILKRHNNKMKKEIKAKSLMCCVKNKTSLSHEVADPMAMPVTVASKEQLAPFLTFLKESKDLSLDLSHWTLNLDKLSKFDGVRDLDEKQIEFKSGVFYNDGRMDLCKQVVGRDHIGDLLEAIKMNKNVEHFLLGNNIAGGEKIGEFIKTPHVPKIKTWYVAGNDIDANGIKSIAEGLSNDHDAIGLWLKRNPIMSDGAKYIGEMLKHNTTLEVLDLFNCGLLDKGIEEIFSGMLQNRTLKHIFLGANGITHKSVYSIANYFKQLVEMSEEGLDSLKMTVNQIGDEGAICLAEGLDGYHPLKRLALCSNRITSVGVKKLVETLKELPNLIFFDIGYFKSTFDLGELPNSIKDEGAEAIADLLKVSKLQGLNIVNNGITLNGLNKILEVCRTNDYLCFFEYAQYGLVIPKEMSLEFKDIATRNFTEFTV